MNVLVGVAIDVWYVKKGTIIGAANQIVNVNIRNVLGSWTFTNADPTSKQEFSVSVSVN